MLLSRFLNVEVEGTTLIEGPDYTGLTWHPGSKRARGKALDNDVATVAARIAERFSKAQPGPGEPRSFTLIAVQTEVMILVAGGAAEMALLGDAPPQYIASDMRSANAIAAIVCHTAASRAAFIEHCYQEAFLIIEQHKHVGLALAQALINHPEPTLNAVEIDEVIAQAISTRAAEAERQRRVNWVRICANAATFKPDADFPKRF